MNLKDKLFALSTYFGVTRNVGHTRTLIEGLKSAKDTILVTHNLKYGNDIKRQTGIGSRIVSIEEISSVLRGLRSPLVIDNKVIKDICEESFAVLVDLEQKKSELELENQILQAELKDLDFQSKQKNSLLKIQYWIESQKLKRALEEKEKSIFKQDVLIICLFLVFYLFLWFNTFEKYFL